MSLRRLVPVAALTAVAATGCTLPGAPQPVGGEYPSKTVNVIVPYAAGGPTDVAARAMSECLGTYFDTRFIVENRDGGAGAIGTLEMLASRPDGYTLGVGTSGSVAIAPLLSEHATYEPSDIKPITKIYELASALVVLDDSRYTSGKQLLDDAKKGRKVTVAVGGASTEYALELRRMAKDYGINLTVVPFAGGAPAQNGLLGGNVDALFAAVNQPLMGLIKDGTIRPLFTGGEKRAPHLPEVPTLAELGYKKLTNTTAFFALAGPAGMDSEVVKRLRAGASHCQEDPTLRKQLGANFIPKQPGTPASISREWAESSADAKEILK